ncbi:MAG: DMT family transporter [Ilumatobacteraceae bacterium]
MQGNKRLIGIVLALASATLYGVTPYFVNIAFDHGTDPFGLMTARYIIASAVLLVIRLIRLPHAPWPSRRTFVHLFLLGAIGLYLNSVCVFSALRLMDSGLVMVLFYFYPIVVVLLSWSFHGHKPDSIIWLCLASTVGGVALSASDISGGAIGGVILIIIGAFTYAIYSVIGSRLMPNTDVMTGLLIVLFGAACSFTLVWLINPPGMPTTMPRDLASWLSALEIAVPGTIVAMGLFFAGMNRIGAGKSAVVQTSEVLVTVTMGLMFLGESLTLRQVIGAMLILGGVVLLAQKEAKRADLPAAQLHV